MPKKLYALTIGLVFSCFCAVAQPVADPGLRHHTEKGLELFEAGRYRAARAEFAKAKELLTPDTREDAVRIDYMLAQCSAKAGDRNAMEQLEGFMADYPNSAYSNDMRFAIANLLYMRQDYDRARREYIAVSPFDLRVSQQDEYNFKLGHTFFLADDHTNSANSLKMVGSGSEFYPHARYYLAYMDYVAGNYAAAKREFSQLQSNPVYAKVIPFYILQIEFLEGNYDYVTANGDAMLSAATGERETEIARIMAEAWFHKGDYEKVLRYMDTYIRTGGNMGRGENYLLGYARYMRNDIRDAAEALALVVGPDDKLTQNAAYHLGGAYLRLGDKQRAMQSFSMAAGAEYDPAIREEALFNYGKLQYELGGGVFNEAINILNRYIDEYPDSPRVTQAREYLIAAYYNSRNYDAAYEAIKLMPDPDNNIRAAYQKIAYFRALEYYNDGDYDAAYRLLAESYNNKFNPKYTALTQFWKGEIHYRRGEYGKAIPLYKEFISLSPATGEEYKMAQYNLGYAYFNQEQWSEARSWFDRFVSSYRNKDNYLADAYNRIGDTQFVAREFTKAVASYDAAAAIGTDERYYARYRRAVTLGFTGGTTRKIDGLRDLISAGQGGYIDAAMYELSRTYIGQERFADGAAMLKRLIDEYPSSGYYNTALSDLGLAYQNLGDNKTALNYYKILIDKAPASKQAQDAMIAVKSIYVDMNDVDGYFAFAGKTGIETDTGAVARDSLAYAAAERVYMTSGDKGRVISSWKDYLAKYPRGAYRANALFNLADTYITAGQADEGMEALGELGGMHFNSFTVRGLEKLAPMAYERKRYDDAAEAYRKLATTAVNASTVSGAWSGYLKSIKATGDDGRIALAADEVMAAKGVSANVIREARFAKAGTLSRSGDQKGALALYKELATESQSVEGAESTFHVIESMYKGGDLDGAEKMILKFAGQNTPHAYWLGRAFLTLGDIYIDKGDSFQARATLQSVIDGYTPADDGIVAGARERIEKLGDK